MTQLLRAGHQVTHFALQDRPCQAPEDECRFVYDLCAAARFLIVNPQRPPMVVVPTRTHTTEEASIGGWPEDPDDVVWVDSSHDLQTVLRGGFERFLEYMRRVTGT